MMNRPCTTPSRRIKAYFNRYWKRGIKPVDNLAVMRDVTIFNPVRYFEFFIYPDFICLY